MIYLVLQQTYYQFIYFVYIHIVYISIGYGTADLCASQVHQLADLLTSLPANHNPGYIHLSMLLWRLVPLMAQEHQVSLYMVFAPNPCSGLRCIEWNS